MTQQLQLIEGAAPPRPNPWHDEETIAAVAERLLPQVIQWLGKEWVESERESTLEHLRRALDRELDWDGYDLAKATDFVADASLVEILDAADSHRSAIRRAAIAAWVRDWGIAPKLAVGETVSVPAEICRRGPSGVEADLPGTITHIDHQQAMYVVNIPDLGHHPPGSTECGTLGLCIEFEQLEEQSKTAPK